MELAEQFRGCLLGLAVGDALGAPADGLTPAQLRTEHGLLREMASGRYGRRPGQAGAPTEFMLCVLETYNVRGAFDAQEICDCLVEQARAPRTVPDAMTALACRMLSEGWNFERAAQLAYELATPVQRLSAGCLPRVVPPGLLHYHDDLHLIGESRIVCGLTHQGEMAKMSCVAFNLALQHMLLVGTGGLLEELLVWLEPRSPELYAWLREVPRLRPERLDAGGSAPATVQAALWAALYVTDFEEGATLLLGRGEAASVVGAMGGALLGARFGAGGIPARWLEHLELRQSIERQAERMFLLSQQVSLPVKPGDEPLSANPRLLPPEI